MAIALYPHMRGPGVEELATLTERRHNPSFHQLATMLSSLPWI